MRAAEVGSIPVISGTSAIEYRNRYSRYYFKNSAFHSIPFQNASIPFQIAGMPGILKTRAPKKKKRKEKRKKKEKKKKKKKKSEAELHRFTANCKLGS